jgi:acetyltransferase-like isoleucine patch superfamily enzyme
MSPAANSSTLPGRAAFSLFEAAAQPFRRAWLRATGVKTGRNCVVVARVQAALGRDLPRTGWIELGAAVRLSYGVVLQPDVPKPTRIGQDVWLGTGVTVLGGVTMVMAVSSVSARL